MSGRGLTVVAVLVAVLVAVTAVLTGAGGGTAAAQVAGVTSFGDTPGALRLPEALAIAPGGDLLVGDHFGGRIQRFRDGRFVSSFGLRGEGCGRLGAIGGVAADARGNTYVLDSDQQLVQVFAPDGTSTRCFGGRGSALGRLRTGSGSYAASSASGGIAVTDSYVYVADAGNHRVQRFSLTGKNPKILGQGRMDTPQGLAVKGSRLLVADDGNHRVVELTTSGRFVAATSAKAGVRLRFPYDVALDAKGNAYVADNSFHRVVELDRRLRRVRAWGAQGQAHGRFVFPRAVAIQRDGHVLVADAGNDRVQEFTAAGGFIRAIGSNGRQRPRMTAPADVAANGFGEVAVADGNGRLSWFDLAGRFQGAWAQSRSFQQSTAVVSSPDGLDTATDRSLRVVDGGELREYADAVVRDVLAGPGAGARPGSTPVVKSTDVGPTGTVWAVAGTGRFARVPAASETPPSWLGTRSRQGRSTTAIAELADGSVAIAEGTSPHQRTPADGTVARYDAAGRRLSIATIPRPAGGRPSRPGGLAATADGGLWVTDSANDVVLRLAADGTVAQRLGAPGTGDGGLAEPRGVELDCSGGLLVADSGNNRVVRFAGVAPARGCAAAPAPTADGRPPGPVGLKLKTRSRVRAPAAELGTIRATCVRTCTLKVIDAGAAIVQRGTAKRLPLTATVSGATITLRASARVLKALHSGPRREGSVSASVVVTGTSKDGVVDTAAVYWAFSRQHPGGV